MRKERSFTIDALIELYELSNQAEGKSGRTITWYRYILGTFSQYAQHKLGSSGISVFNIDNVRQYVLDLRNRKASKDTHTHIPRINRFPARQYRVM